MATMIPNDVEEFGTDGEGVFFNFLRSVAKPDSRYITWYLPGIKDRKPDFLLYCEDVGLVIFEVKDWTLNQIREANPHSFLAGGKVNVYLRGHSQVNEGKSAKVTGIYRKQKRVGKYTFQNEIEATEIENE